MSFNLNNPPKSFINNYISFITDLYIDNNPINIYIGPNIYIHYLSQSENIIIPINSIKNWIKKRNNITLFYEDKSILITGKNNIVTQLHIDILNQILSYMNDNNYDKTTINTFKNKHLLY